MNETVNILGTELEYDFISAWIKYTRLEKHYSQDALSHGICSTSHLCYFEKGERKLRPEIIEALLKKLDITEINDFESIGLLRQNLYNMLVEIEVGNHTAATAIYTELCKLENLIKISPYNIEFKIHQLFYRAFIEKVSPDLLIFDVNNLDKIASSLNDELKYLFYFISGKIIYKYKNHGLGLSRLLAAHKIRETPWLNYNLGFCYCFDNAPLRGTYYLEKALNSYQSSSRFLNVLWCHDNLAICYSFLKLFDKAESHLLSALNGAQHFHVNDLNWNIYVNLSHVYLSSGKIEEGMKWAKKSLAGPEPVLAATNYVEACSLLGLDTEVKNTFDKYLSPEFKDSRYYPFLRYAYLLHYHGDEEIFFEETTKTLLPFYKKINYIDQCRQMKLGLIQYLEKKRRYKDATKLYKELL